MRRKQSAVGHESAVGKVVTGTVSRFRLRSGWPYHGGDKLAPNTKIPAAYRLLCSQPGDRRLFYGIFLHQSLQWRHLLSGIRDRGADLRSQVTADPAFHLAM